MMDTLIFLKQGLWSQFGASIDMLEKAVALTPESLLNKRKRLFYTVYHTQVFLDYYLTVPPKGFISPLPFTITHATEIPAEALDDVVPDRAYTKEELLGYLQSIREKCRRLIFGLTEEKMQERWVEDPSEGKMNYSLFEILLYNMRHVQHHTAQLNIMLRDEINRASPWVGRAKDQITKNEN